MTTDAQTHTFRVGDIQPNPFRHIERYPIREDKVAALRESLRKTGFWGNVVARIREDGKPEIAYGHHRREALIREFGPEASVPLIIQDLDDTTMLQIMARENMDEWGTSAAVEQETVRATVEAYAEGKIELSAPDTANRNQWRWAPSFQMGAGSPSAGGHRPYTRTALAEFLGWTKTKVGDALGALELIEREILSEADFEDLTTMQARATVTGTRKREREFKKTADSWDRAAEEASTPQARTAAKTRARKYREGAAREASDFGRAVSRTIRDTDTGYRDAAQEVREGRRSPKPPKQEPQVDLSDLASHVAGLAANYLINDPETEEALNLLVEHRDQIPPLDRENVVRSLISSAERARECASEIAGFQFGNESAAEAVKMIQRRREVVVA